jgi:SpoVK/Ycf46/Vps4 family AAA+-type ATPase
LPDAVTRGRPVDPDRDYRFVTSDFNAANQNAWIKALQEVLKTDPKVKWKDIVKVEDQVRSAATGAEALERYLLQRAMLDR